MFVPHILAMLGAEVQPVCELVFQGFFCGFTVQAVAAVFCFVVSQLLF
jgi:hypothetical protein